MSIATAPATTTDREIEFKRVFNATREMVYKAWTDPTHMARWWGPYEFTNPVCEMDARVGGAYRIVMRSPEGKDHPIKGSFLEVFPMEKLVLTMDLTEHDAEFHSAINAHMNGAARSGEDVIITTVTFTERDDATALSVRQRFATAAERDAHANMGAPQGWGQSFDKLEELLVKG
ncbi:MAG: SRPBCC domain-containing protein [Flavobacteriales bacterium]